MSSSGPLRWRPLDSRLCTTWFSAGEWFAWSRQAGSIRFGPARRRRKHRAIRPTLPSTSPNLWPTWTSTTEWGGSSTPGPLSPAARSNGEVRRIVQRTWEDDGGSVSIDQLVSMHEVRGQGRNRYMLRPWGFQSDSQEGWNTWADNASALWTVYDGDEPTCDYRMIDHPTLGLVPYPEISYTLGLAQRTGAGDVRYFHTDHLGTTLGMTDADQVASARIVYTAFGEVIDTEGTVDTRYQYVGKDGYETFDALPFMHVGYRWYDPDSGRFLQRDPIGNGAGLIVQLDPIGIETWLNVYAYAKGNPSGFLDPSGLVALPEGAGIAIYDGAGIYKGADIVAKGAQAARNDLHRRHILSCHPGASAGDYVRGCATCKKLKFAATRKAARARQAKIAPKFAWWQFWAWGL